MMDMIQVTDITNMTDITDKQMYNKWEKVQIKRYDIYNRYDMCDETITKRFTELQM